MNGISCLMSKAFCPIYKPGTCNKINILPHRSSNLHFQDPCPLLTTTRMLKHRVSVYSPPFREDVAGSRLKEVTEIHSSVHPYCLIGFSMMSIALFKPELFFKSKAPYAICLEVAAGILATSFLGRITYGLSLLQDKPFSIGDKIQVGSVKGQVIEMGLLTISLLNAENRTIKLPTSMFYKTKFIVEKSGAWQGFVSEIPVQMDEIDETFEITEEIREMMKCNSNVYLEEKQPSCYMSYWEKNRGGVLTLTCSLKPMSEEELSSAKKDILLDSLQIVKNHMKGK